MLETLSPLSRTYGQEAKTQATLAKWQSKKLQAYPSTETSKSTQKPSISTLSEL